MGSLVLFPAPTRRRSRYDGEVLLGVRVPHERQRELTSSLSGTNRALVTILLFSDINAVTLSCSRIPPEFDFFIWVAFSLQVSSIKRVPCLFAGLLNLSSFAFSTARACRAAIQYGRAMDHNLCGTSKPAAVDSHMVLCTQRDQVGHASIHDRMCRRFGILRIQGEEAPRIRPKL